MSYEQIIDYIAQIIILLILIAIIKFFIWIIKLIYNIFHAIVTGTRKLSWNSKKIIAHKSNTKRDLDSILLHTKVCIRQPRFHYEPDYNIYESFHRNPYNMDNLKNATMHILKYVGYTGPEPSVQYGILGSELSNHVINIHRAYITINSEPRKKPEELYALLIHECMNLYIFNKKIEFSSYYPKGYAADVIAVYLGFYDFMKQGYKHNGYLNIKELKYIKKQISH